VPKARMQGMLGGSCESACQARQCRRQIRKAPGTEMAAHELETECTRYLSRNVDDPRQGEGGGRRTVQLRGVELNLSSRSQTYVL
jgi:hypothetical protein